MYYLQNLFRSFASYKKFIMSSLYSHYWTDRFSFKIALGRAVKRETENLSGIQTENSTRYF